MPGGRQGGIPQWVEDEVRSARFGRPAAIKRTGHILEAYGADGKIDAQLYDPVEDGLHIITMDLAPDVRTEGLRRGVAYEFSIDSFKAPPSPGASGYLREEVGIDMARCGGSSCGRPSRSAREAGGGGRGRAGASGASGGGGGRGRPSVPPPRPGPLHRP